MLSRWNFGETGDTNFVKIKRYFRFREMESSHIHTCAYRYMHHVSQLWTHASRYIMPQSHPTTGPVRFLSPVRFLARKAEWSARRNFTSVLFSWSHQATGPVRLDTAVHLWFGRMIRRTPRVPRTMPVRASCGPRKGIFNVFHILRGPYGAREGPARVPCDTLVDT